MKYLLSVAAIAVALSPVHAGGTLMDARTRLLRGNYAEAQEIYADLAKKNPKMLAEATVGLSRALESEGLYDEALAAVDKALPKTADNADLLARRGELLHVRGRWNDAEKAARKAIEKNDQHFLARWVLGQVLRDRGELDKADEEFRWFVKTYTKRSNDDMEITDPETLHLVGLAGSERARWHHLSDQFQFILSEIYAEAAKKDKDYWWAEYEEGRLFLEKFNKSAAERALDKALAINPRAAEALACKAGAAMQRLDLKEADLYADQALKVNPRLTTALRVKADVFLFGSDLAQAMKYLDAARAVNPRDEMTLARVAVCLSAPSKKAELAALVKDVESHNPKAAIFYSELAGLLDGKRSYDEAEKYYLRSMELQPKLPGGINGLGLLYMRMGKEPEALKLLEKGNKADKFNLLVVNSLKVLDHLANYDTRKTEHFIIRYDARNDQILANFLEKYLEDIYEEYAAKFKYRPKGPFLIEVFNRHEMFSGRVIAMPDLHTIGACTGGVVAMVSPRDKQRVVRKPFNWMRVIRHELVHVFNLDQTRFQVPHWLTEGLAVSLEGTPPPPNWQVLLADATRAGDLLNLDTVLLGFARPRSPDEWQLAYYQSLLYVEYAVKNHGEGAIGALLAAYVEGPDTDAALQKALKVSKADFEKGYKAFVAERVKEGGERVARRAMTFKQLKEAHAKDPDDADVAAQLADRFYSQGKKREARELAEKVLIAKNRHPLAAAVKALLLLDGGEPEKAITLLRTNVDDKTSDPKALKLLARMQMQAKQFAEAARTLEQGRLADPTDSSYPDSLSKLYGDKVKDPAKLTEVLKELVRHDPDNLDARLKLARKMLDDGNQAEAESYARQVLDIDVLNAEGQNILLQALMGQNKDDQVRLLKKLLEQK